MIFPIFSVKKAFEVWLVKMWPLLDIEGFLGIIIKKHLQEAVTTGIMARIKIDIWYAPSIYSPDIFFKR